MEFSYLRLKSEDQIACMQRAGRVVAAAHQRARDLLCLSVSTAELDEEIRAVLRAHHAEPVFQRQRGQQPHVPFPATSCISVNDEIAHGIPGKRRLRPGDIVSIDIACRLDGWCADAAYTYPIGHVSPECRRLLDVTRRALDRAIALIGHRRLWSAIAREIARSVAEGDCYVLGDLTGHGIGRELWETPAVPNVASPTFARLYDFRVEPGLVLAIEPVVALRETEVRLRSDGWTLVTEGSIPSAHFEHTVAVLEDGPLILTEGIG